MMYRGPRQGHVVWKGGRGNNPPAVAIQPWKKSALPEASSSFLIILFGIVPTALKRLSISTALSSPPEYNMKFGRQLKNSIYAPWKDSYIDYSKLKHLLREDRPEEEDREWTEQDESTFVEELVNVQLEKVNAFQASTYENLQNRVANCESQLEKVAEADKKEDQEQNTTEPAEKDILPRILSDLDSVSKEINELEKYSRINYTGFLKAAKKHDRRRGSRYRVRPLLQVRLAALPFNSEDYSPLLYRLSTLYTYTRQRLDGGKERSQSRAESKDDGDKFVAYKFWVHPDNLLEVKTYILRRLPLLVYNPQTAKNAEGGQMDPSITSLYFDNSDFSLHNEKIEHTSGASSLRLRWYGPLSEKPDIMFEKKTVGENEESEEVRFPIKDKYVEPFIKGEYKMEKAVEKAREKEGANGNGASSLQASVEEIQNFIQQHQLQPVLRANYTRTAFQIPGDDRVRISIDTDLALIREDALDQDRPCRSPDEWHRADIDRLNLKYPFSEIRQGEISRFPHALLEVKLKGSARKKSNGWLHDLMSSHLVKEAPRFSKFVHGVACLFEDYVNIFPFWLSDLETDIRKDPETAFQEEQDKKAKQAEDELAVGSFMGSKSPSSFQRAVGSPLGKQSTTRSDKKSSLRNGLEAPSEEQAPTDDEVSNSHDSTGKNGLVSGLLSLSPFSNSKYARAHRAPAVQLPPGVRPPGKLIKDMNPVKVEPKVWLANQRTFVKWQHISVLLATLSLALYNAAGESNGLARGLAIVYTIIALFAGGWGWWMYMVRSRMIMERSGKDFDNVIGPAVVCIGLVVALLLNFGFKVSKNLYPTAHHSILSTFRVFFPSTQKTKPMDVNVDVDVSVVMKSECANNCFVAV